MEPETPAELASGIMLDFARKTGLSPAGLRPRRYLWTDAFAVCTYLGLYCQVNDRVYLDLALDLVDQVHHVLGRHRDDDSRTGWISGLSDFEGEMHPTKGGLRIGKRLPERGPNEPFDERLEWDRDGQYFHYLMKWMHALRAVGRVTGDPKYDGWAIELAQTAHARFSYLPPNGGAKKMFWKMSSDLSRPLVHSMGQHDPLDGFVTFSKLREAAGDVGGTPPMAVLTDEIAELAGMCRGLPVGTIDPLATGGLLCDALWLAQQMVRGSPGHSVLLSSVVDAATRGTAYFIESRTLHLPAGYRLAFRELGLSIGLQGAVMLADLMDGNPDIFLPGGLLQQQADALAGCKTVAQTIEKFWLDKRNHEPSTWTEHHEINMVMLATSLAPSGFLST